MEGGQITDTLKALHTERVRLQGEIKKLDSAIVVLKGLVGSGGGHAGKRTMSAATRRKMAKAQKARWARLRQQKTSKN